MELDCLIYPDADEMLDDPSTVLDVVDALVDLDREREHDADGRRFERTVDSPAPLIPAWPKSA